MFNRYICAVVLLCVSLSMSADYCYMVEHTDDEGLVWYERVCEPEYYVWQYTKPNWCLYENLSEVDIRHGADFQPNAWYVTPPSDLKRGGDWVIVNQTDEGGGCYLFHYPW